MRLVPMVVIRIIVRWSRYRRDRSAGVRRSPRDAGGTLERRRSSLAEKQDKNRPEENARAAVRRERERGSQEPSLRSSEGFG